MIWVFKFNTTLHYLLVTLSFNKHPHQHVTPNPKNTTINYKLAFFSTKNFIYLKETEIEHSKKEWTKREWNARSLEVYTLAEPMSFLLAASLIAFCTLFSSLCISETKPIRLEKTISKLNTHPRIQNP